VYCANASLIQQVSKIVVSSHLSRINGKYGMFAR
jgi:hypothetical protein